MTILDCIYVVTGFYLLIFGVYSFFDRNNLKRHGTSFFWSTYGVLMIFGKMLPDWVAGVLVIVLALIPGFGLMGRGKYEEINKKQRERDAENLGLLLFVPVLIIPIGTMFIGGLTSLGALVGLGLSALVALAVTLRLTGEPLKCAVQEGRRTVDALGWTAVISLYLATIGQLFNGAGLGDSIALVIKAFSPGESKLLAVALYCFGMMFFSFILGNAFAAYAIVTTGIGLPFLVEVHGGDPAVLGVLAMLSGYSGSIISPLAGNFTLVPTALLKIKDQFGIAKAELPVVLIMLFIHMTIMYFVI